MELYERAVVSDTVMMQRLWELDGATLMCHCTPAQHCHGDILIKLVKVLKASAKSVGGAAPPSDEQARAAADFKKASVEQSGVSAATAERRQPTRICGSGDPIFVGSGDRKRLLADEAGLYSPGLWPPERRHPLKGIALLIHKAFSFELKAWAKALEGGLTKVLADLASGRLKDDPFPLEATTRLRD